MVTLVNPVSGRSYDIRPCTIGDVKVFCSRFHGYHGAGKVAVYAFGVYEDGAIVAAYAWQPPPLGSAKNVCPDAPYGVLALSRMVAVPRAQRRLNHVSKPLRYQMRGLIDRTRWPVLVTYSDEGEGHTGYVYKCSGWQKRGASERPWYTCNGERVSSYRDGHDDLTGLEKGGMTTIQRWEHWIDPDPKAWMEVHGWRRVAVPGKRWRSGAQAYTWERHQPTAQCEMF